MSNTFIIFSFLRDIDDLGTVSREKEPEPVEELQPVRRSSLVPAKINSSTYLDMLNALYQTPGRPSTSFFPWRTGASEEARLVPGSPKTSSSEKIKIKTPDGHKSHFVVPFAIPGE